MAKKPYPSEVLDRYIVRLPAGMRERISESAKRHGRSMNSEIVLILDEYYQRQDFHDQLVDGATGEAAMPASGEAPDFAVPLADQIADLVFKRLSGELGFVQVKEPEGSAPSKPARRTKPKG